MVADAFINPNPRCRAALDAGREQKTKFSIALILIMGVPSWLSDLYVCS